jgi:hypothetical protein
MHDVRVIPFRRVLPIAQLIVCAFLLAPWAGFLWMQMRGVAHNIWPTRVRQPVYVIHASLEPETPATRRRDELAGLRVSVPAMLNIPSGFLGLARPELMPKSMFPPFWRAITWPLVGIVFWWIAGRAVDALLSIRRRVFQPSITWIEAAVGALLFAGCVGICVSFLADQSSRSEFIFPWRPAAIASGLWAILGATIFASRIAQWRLRRHLKIQPAPTGS